MSENERGRHRWGCTIGHIQIHIATASTARTQPATAHTHTHSLAHKTTIERDMSMFSICQYTNIFKCLISTMAWVGRA